MPPAEYHATLGPSAAKRWINCPASVSLGAGVEKTTSKYAEAGRTAHELAELKARKRFTPMNKRTYTSQLKKIQAGEFYASEMEGYTDRRTVQIALTAYDEKDEHYESSWQRLSGVVDECLTLLGGVLKVGDRRFKPTLKSLPREPDRAVILIDFSFMTPKSADGQTGETAKTLCTSLTVNGKKI